MRKLAILILLVTATAIVAGVHPATETRAAPMEFIYYTWADAGTAKIQRANLDGSNVVDLVTDVGRIPNGIALDIAGGNMYWTGVQPQPLPGRIRRASLEGANKVDLPIPGLVDPRGIAKDDSAGKIYWTDAGTDKIQRSNLDGSKVEDLVSSSVVDPEDVDLDLAGGKMYWTETGRIRRANLEIPPGETPFFRTDVEDLVAGGGSAGWIALDLEGGKMYWTETGRIRRANLEIPPGETPFFRTDVEDLVISVLAEPVDIALDLAGRKMYWTTDDGGPGPDRIQRANLEIPPGETPSTRTDVEDLVTGLTDPMGIALDIPPPVGGIAELPDVAGTPLEAGGSSGVSAAVLAGIAAAVAAVVALGGAAWWARRRS